MKKGSKCYLLNVYKWAIKTLVMIVVAITFAYFTDDVFPFCNQSFFEFIKLLLSMVLQNTSIFNPNILAINNYKPIEFYQEYVNELYFILNKGRQEGRTEYLFNDAKGLETIRHRYIIYISEEVNDILEGIEARMKKIGADCGSLRYEPIGDKRNGLIEKVALDFMELFNKPKHKNNKSVYIDDIISLLETSANKGF